MWIWPKTGVLSFGENCILGVESKVLKLEDYSMALFDAGNFTVFEMK